MADFHNHDSVEATATIAAATADFKVRRVEYIKNDDATNNLIVNFDRLPTARGFITIKPSEVAGPFDRTCSVLHYKSSALTVAFRAFGVS